MKKLLTRIIVAAIAMLGFSYAVYAWRLEEKLLRWSEPYVRKLTGQG